MRFSLLLAASLAAVGLAAPSPAPFPPLSENVLRDLRSRDPSTYSVYSLTNGTDASHLVGRDAPNGLTGVRTRGSASRSFAYTFDDGSYTREKRISSFFSSKGSKTTFFVNGNNYRCIYDKGAVSSLRDAYAKGHQICMHTWSHPHLPQLSNSQIDTQVQLLEDALYKIIGAVPACIRAPYGEITDAQVRYLNDRWGLVVVGWNMDSGDANGDGVQAALNRYRALKAPKHVIALNHETVVSAVDETMPQAYDILRNNGYSAANIMTVASALQFNPYKVQGQQGTRDASWTCDGTPAPGAS